MHFKYPVKHWLTTLTLGPLLMIIYDAFISTRLMNESVGIYILFLMFGVCFSLPAFFLYLFIYNRIIKEKISNLSIKTILNVIGVTLVIAIFLLIKGSMSQLLIFCYSIAIVVGSLFYRLRPREVKF
jgi:hypothetical protein